MLAVLWVRALVLRGYRELTFLDEVQADVGHEFFGLLDFLGLRFLEKPTNMNERTNGRSERAGKTMDEGTATYEFVEDRVPLCEVGEEGSPSKVLRGTEDDPVGLGELVVLAREGIEGVAESYEGVGRSVWTCKGGRRQGRTCESHDIQRGLGEPGKDIDVGWTVCDELGPSIGELPSR